MLGPLDVFALACRLNPSALSSFATVGGETLCPAADIASANRRTDFVVHRSGDSGSPREPGSTSDSSVAITPGSVSVTDLRPPPGRRVRPNGSSPASSSATPLDTVTALMPAARPRPP